jgi:hypothetical protein
MWGMYLGLNFTWKEHISHLIVESDSKILIDMIMDYYKFSGTIPVWFGAFVICWLWIDIFKFVTLGGKADVVLIGLPTLAFFLLFFRLYYHGDSNKRAS